MSRRAHRSTTTGGSDEREARALSGPLLRFELAQEAARLRAETSFLDSDRNARTLTKAGAFRLVLVVFRAGAAFDENDQRGSVALRFWTAGSMYGPGKTRSRSVPAKSRSCRLTNHGERRQ